MIHTYMQTLLSLSGLINKLLTFLPLKPDGVCESTDDAVFKNEFSFSFFLKQITLKASVVLLCNVLLYFCS